MNDSRRSTKRRILVVANATAEGVGLEEAIRDRVRDSEAEVLVVAATLDSRASSEDEAFGEAEARLRRCLQLLDWAGIEANGVVVGAADPLRAIADVLHGFPADELVIATNPEARSPWLSRPVEVVVDGSSGTVGYGRQRLA